MKQLIWIVVLGLVVTACQRPGARRQPTDGKAPRSGTNLEPVNIDYYDARPSIDAAAEKIVFVSGRAKSLQIFKYDATVTDAEPSRLLPADTDIGVERYAAISTGGSWVMIQGVRGAQVDLSYVDFAGTKTPAFVTDDVSYEFDFSFADDSVFAFVKSATGTRYGQIMVGAIAGDGALTAPVALTSPSGLVEYNPTWQASGGNLTLLTLGRDEATQRVSLITRTFSDVATAATSSPQVWMSNLAINYSSFMPMAVGSAAGVYYAAAPATPKTMRPSGGTQESTKDIRVLAEPYLIGAANAQPQDLDALGFDVRGLTANTDGTLVGWVGAELFACEEEAFGFAMHLYKTTGGVTERLIPLSGLEPDTWELAAAPCLDKSEDEEEGEEDSDSKRELDYRIEAMQLAATSTPTNYKIVYVSTATVDHEVMLLRVVNGAATFQSVSQNKKP